MNLINVTVVLTLLLGFIFLTKKNKFNKLLLFILIISVLNEIICFYLVSKKQSIALSSSIYTLFLIASWLQIILLNYSRKLRKFTIFIFVAFAVVNFMFFDGISAFNMHTFLFGSFLYLLIFGFYLFRILEDENFRKIQLNSFILIGSPVFFFFGFALIFAFKTKKIDTIILFNNISLYVFVSYFVNIIYYTLLNIYIFKERKLHHA